jgi:hypothetical protein
VRARAHKAVDKKTKVKTEDEEAEDSEGAKKNTLSDDDLQKQMDELEKLRELLKGAKTG